MKQFGKKLRRCIINSSNDEDDTVTALAVQIPETELLEVEKSRQRGSVDGHSVVDRDIGSGHTRIHNDYFSDNPVYPESVFQRRFRMSKKLFLRIERDIEQNFDYFKQPPYAAGQMGASSLQKITAALRMLAYGCPADSVDEYVRLGESTSISLDFFLVSSSTFSDSAQFFRVCFT